MDLLGRLGADIRFATAPICKVACRETSDFDFSIGANCDACIMDGMTSCGRYLCQLQDLRWKAQNSTSETLFVFLARSVQILSVKSDFVTQTWHIVLNLLT